MLRAYHKTLFLGFHTNFVTFIFKIRASQVMRRSVPIILIAALPFFSNAQSTAVPAWKLLYDSAQIFWGKQWDKTVPLLSRAEKSALYDLGIYDENYLVIINDLGLAYAKIGDFANAEKLLNKGISIKSELNSVPNPDLYRSFLNLATVHAEQGHVADAEKLYKRIISGLTSTPDPELNSQAFKNLLTLYEVNDRPAEALALVDNIRSDELDNPEDQSLMDYELKLTRVRLNRKLGKHDTATSILGSTMNELAKEKGKKFASLYIQCLQESGLLASETGLFNKAEKDLLQAFRLIKAETPVNNQVLTAVLNDLATVYEKIGLQEKALAYYQDALALSIQDNGANAMATLTLQSNIAGIWLRQGLVKEALTSFVSIEKRLRTITSEANPNYITILNNLATAYRRDKQPAEARAALDRAYQLIQKHDLNSDDLAASVMNNMAVLLTASGDFEEAASYYEKAYNLRKTIFGDNSLLLMDLASNLAVVYWELRKPDLALPLFEKSIGLALRQIKYIFPNLSEDEQVQFYKKLKEDFERFNTIAFHAKRSDLLLQVFNNQITIKSLLFFTQRHRNDLVTEKGDTILARQYQVLKSKREQLGYLYQLPLKELSRSGASAANLEKEIDVIEKAISLKTSETVAEKMMEQGFRWNDIQARMGPDEALVEIIRFRKYDLKRYEENGSARASFGFTDSIRYAALITTTETTESPQLVLLSEGQNMETRFLNYYRNALTYTIKDNNSYRFYWQPFDHLIRNKSMIYLSGDGVYHRLNLNTLQDPQTNEYLIQRYNIHYLLNPAQVMEKQKSTFITRNATLMGDPVFDMAESKNAKSRTSDKFASLPGTNAEVVKIKEILFNKGWSAHVYLKQHATEKNLKSVRSPDILHIATHGFFSTDQVKLSAEAKKDFLFYSGLVLTGANRNLDEETQEIYDDGILTAYEVMNLDLTRTHLVVLSACETGLGKIENGEGVYGLQRSFLQAGARNILISLWKVDDKITQELMVSFYQYLFQGKVEREALKLAQLDQLKKYPNPHGWGGFIVVGLD